MEKLHNLRTYNNAVHIQRETIRRGVYCMKYGIDMPVLHALAEDERLKKKKRLQALQAGITEATDE